jgi:dolichyl-phosphate-mannose--protein O-mannosyl transferase
VLALSEVHTLSYAFAALKLVWQRWSLMISISPSALFCFGVMFLSVVWPIAGLMAIAALTRTQRWSHVILTIVALLLFPFVTDFLIWGSFPLPLDDEGNIHLRLIPFIPWPSGGFGHYEF